LSKQKEKPKFRLNYNSPVILTYTFICLAIVIIGYITNGKSTEFAFMIYRTSIADPMFYVRLIGHIFGHADISHFTNNFMLILLAGPMLEEKYGSKPIILMMLFTAVFTGILNTALFPDIALCGASGIAFMFILLSSFVNVKNNNGIPVTVILITVFYLGSEIVNGILNKDNISQFCHIIGGICGGGFGYLISKENK
jgi:membrane associated rhomboid family serine protease